MKYGDEFDDPRSVWPAGERKVIAEASESVDRDLVVLLLDDIEGTPAGRITLTPTETVRLARRLADLAHVVLT